jgi:hypothetical protein
MVHLPRYFYHNRKRGLRIEEIVGGGGMMSGRDAV